MEDEDSRVSSRILQNRYLDDRDPLEFIDEDDLITKYPYLEIQNTHKNNTQVFYRSIENDVSKLFGCLNLNCKIDVKQKQPNNLEYLLLDKSSDALEISSDDINYMKNLLGLNKYCVYDKVKHQDSSMVDPREEIQSKKDNLLFCQQCKETFEQSAKALIEHYKEICM